MAIFHLPGYYQHQSQANERLEILNVLKANGIPHYYLIDKNGVIADTNAPDPDLKARIDKIEQLLN